MLPGLVGRKCGMTRVFTEGGVSIPVSVIQVEPNVITQIKTDGYYAVQVTTASKKTHKLSKAEAGHFAKAGVEPGVGLWEFRVDEKRIDDFKIGDKIGVANFAEIKMVDVQGVSKGKGFAGTIKRWNFGAQRASHGNSVSHRVPGSIGQCQDPGKVFKGKKMCGHLGDATTTVQNLEIVRIDEERGLLLIKGAIPGAPNGIVIIRPAVKSNTANSKGAAA
jgi:large subunit ribosomal protein L3